MTYIKWITYIMMGLCLLVGRGNIVAAEGMGYSVKAVTPDNQLDKSQTYFDLKVSPGATQDLSLEINSTSDDVLELVVEPHVATTNQNGELEFSVTPKTQDATLLYPITDLLSGKQRVTIPAKGSKLVTFRLKIPERGFEGRLVGGFTIYDQENDQAEPVTDQADVQIKNTFSMVIGIQLREQDNLIKPDLKMNGVKAGLFNYRTAILVNLQNTQPDFLGNVNVVAQVKKKGSNKSLYEVEKAGIAFAPNSNFDLPISLENQEIQPGSYELIVEASSGKHKWSLTKSFIISRDEARELNAAAVELEQPTQTGHLLLMVCLIGLFIAVLMVTVGYLISLQKESR